eukprot:4610409-Amphidinium_carterae.1
MQRSSLLMSLFAFIDILMAAVCSCRKYVMIEVLQQTAIIKPRWCARGKSKVAAAVKPCLGQLMLTTII